MAASPPRFRRRAPALGPTLATPVLAALAAVLGGTGLRAQQPASAEALEYFERNVRPLLAQRCHECHGSAKQKSDLRLDHLSYALRGGARGPALVPGDPETSRLVQAVSYRDPDLAMPPKGQLPDDEIATLTRWIAMGAPWPDEPPPDAAAPAAAFDLASRKRSHWAWKPLAEREPPTVDDASWPLDPIDFFVLARLEAAGLRPAPDADDATWLRRVSFDLCGLPPTPAAVAAFLADDDGDAHAMVVDRLLGSPQFGERWARHWLDLVRYAETMGHEYDFAIPNAWRYRDYVIRALNEDLRYDRFLLEHIAGDLVPEPRWREGRNESVVGTGFYWLCEQTHSPVDVRKHRADRIDNQIDVLAKSFLGLTVGCARCHDHKFDAIDTEDYYALAGYLKSSRYAQVPVTPSLLGTPVHAELIQIQSALREGMGEHWAAQAQRVQKWLSIAEPLHQGLPEDERDKPPKDKVVAAAAEARCDHEVLGRWVRALADPPRAAAVPAHRDGDRLLVDFDRQDYADWFVEGDAFGTGPQHGGVVLPEQDAAPRVHLPGRGWAHSATLGRRRQGVLHSPTFTLDRRYVHVRVKGWESRINLVNEGFNVIRRPIYERLKRLLTRHEPHWQTFDVQMWRGNRAYLAFVDQATADLADPDRKSGYDHRGYIAVQRVVLSDLGEPPEAQSEPLEIPEIGTALADAVAAWRRDAVTSAHRAVLQWAIRYRLLSGPDGAVPEPVAAAVAELGRIETELPEVITVPAMVDGTGEDEHVFVRGGHNDLGPVAARRFLSALAGTEPMAIAAGCGRLELARAMLAADAFPARVLANRVWHHLTGVGIVPTVDNLGYLGARPTHRGLLDWLARSLIDDGWSQKRLIRRVVLSRTYRMSSARSEAGERLDPGNELLHRMRVRRLQGEAIRDAVLAVSGGLDQALYGPSVPVHLTRFMTGRGRPKRSGPLDGDGRRSVYLEVRRNFLSPFMLAYDTPMPFATIGRRSRSNVPAQALALLNDPFVFDQSGRWAAAVLASEASSDARIEAMYVAALARCPAADELAAARSFLSDQARSYDADLLDARPWTDLAHALFNVKEFAFLR